MNRETRFAELHALQERIVSLKAEVVDGAMDEPGWPPKTYYTA